LDGGAGDDTLTGYYRGNNTLKGGAGNDTLKLSSTSSNSSRHSNVFEGGAGDDTIIGGYGSDTYVFNAGDGKDIIRDYSGNDKLEFGEGIGQSNLTFARRGGDIVITLVDADGMATGDEITLKDAFNSSGYRIETLMFADG
ncbi:calcium-binding protein, partial [Vibrio parahaemolyticus]|nr:calcium-binding protein [Vibrio parahaemolyticus]